MKTLIAAVIVCAAPLLAQQLAYPERAPADAATVVRGKAIHGVDCAYRHGSAARGGEGGPNLLRAQLACTGY